MALQLIQRLYDHAKQRPDAVAVRRAGSTEAPLTWARLSGCVEALATRLRAETDPAGPILLSCPNYPAYHVAFLGVLAAGRAVFPVSPDLAEPELASAIQLAGVRTAIATSDVSAALARHVDHFIPVEGLTTDEEGRGMGSRQRPRVPVAAHGDAVATPCHDSGILNSPALLLLSSGTTAKPKIVLREGPSIDAVCSNMVGAIAFSPGDVTLAAVPLCHSYGVEHGLLAPVWAGSETRICRGFDLPTVLAELGGGVTIFPGVPFVFEILAQLSDEAVRFPNLKKAYSAGAPLPRAVAQAFAKRYGVGLRQVYGATEIGSVTFSAPGITPSPVTPGEGRGAGDSRMGGSPMSSSESLAGRLCHEPDGPASVGTPMAGVDIRILDVSDPDPSRPLAACIEGQVAVRATSMFTRYLGDGPAPLLDGFFLTGDLGKLDAGGALTPTGRLKLLIDIGGMKVNPIEVEEVLTAHPSVGGCVVIAVAVSQTVSRLKAVITARPGGPPVNAEELRAFARARLAGHKVPRLIEVRESLPKSPTGKILRHLVSASVD